MSNTLTTTWNRATELADATPATRNRYVDFLRALSIIAVVLGHWLIAAPTLRNGDILGINMLAVEPWTQWLTWGFQVMPIFFVVGGYSNAASWRAHRSSDKSYGDWLGSRLRRLVLPAVPVVVVWSAFAVAARAFGIDGSLLRLGSQVALIPLWFLAVYVLVVALTPVTLELWDRHGFVSVAAIATAALAVDVLRFQTGELIGWANFVFVFGSVHQLGYAWRDGRLGGTGRRAATGAAGLVALIALVALGPYPVSMVGVPGAEASNNSPPTIALIALGFAQAGLLLALERPVTRWLQRRRAWAATIAVNGSIMTLYLWHLTAMVALVGGALLLGGWGMDLEPASSVWWTTRPLWVAALTIATIPFVGAFARYERPRAAPSGNGVVALMVAALACIGFANIAGGGIANSDTWLRPEAVLPVLGAGALLWRRPATN